MCFVWFVCLFFFFFKQKTAYEMRISDWSSDVCSSDLARSTASGWRSQPVQFLHGLAGKKSRRSSTTTAASRHRSASSSSARSNRTSPCSWCARCRCRRRRRSEEHTSELQSLMRTSYAVFCLKKTKNDTPSQAPHYYI